MNVQSSGTTHFVVIFKDDSPEPGENPYKIAPRVVIAKPNENILFVNSTDLEADIQFVGATPLPPGDYKVSPGKQKHWPTQPVPTNGFPYRALLGPGPIEAQASRPIIIILD
jgi:hypothetical protein